MDRIFAKLDRQEKARHAQMTEQMFNRSKAFIDKNLSNLRTRLANSNSEEEKDVIRAWMQAFNNKMDKLMKNTVYGVSAMQQAAAPIPPERPMRTVEDIRLGKLELAKPETELVQ
jgi:type I restriction-modification system DNA methylase subunit